jgi:FkbM family methyltransferase
MVAFAAFRWLVRALSGWRLRRFRAVDWAYNRAFDRLRPPFARVGGHVVHVDPHDRVFAQGLLVRGAHEPFETELFEGALGPGQVVFCLGAHVGYYALLAARGVGPRGRVYAFEPSPDTFRLLVRNLETNGYANVTAVPKAVSNFTGPGRLYLNAEHNTGDHQIYPGGGARRSVDIEVVRLDDWVRGREAVADVILMDLQGAEMLALEGMDELLSRSPAVRIFTELWPDGLRQAGRSVDAYLARLTRLGFRLSVIDESARRLVPLAGVEDLGRYRHVLGRPNYALNVLGVRP